MFSRFPWLGRLLGYALGLAAVSGSAAETNRVFRAGAAALDISPWMGVSINGNMTDHTGTNLHDALHARALVLDDGQHRLAIVVADSCMIYRETFDAAKKRVTERCGLPPENILMAATHAHSAPASVSIFQSDANPEYQHFLSLRLADAILQGINNLQPAQIGWGSGQAPQFVSNRRWKMQSTVTNVNPFGGIDAVKMNPYPGSTNLVEPAGPIDPEVFVLAVRGTNGQPLSVLANYSLHYCGGVPERTYSADYFGAFCTRLQQRLGAPAEFVALFSNGTSGDCNGTNFREPYKNEMPYERIRRVADGIAALAQDTYGKIAWQDWVELKSAQREITLGVRLPSAEDIVRAQEILDKAAKKSGKLPGWGSEVYARETILLKDFPPQMKVLLQTHRIGGLGIAAIPCEVFAEIGLAIKKESAVRPCFTIELANGYHGYLPTAAQHRLGGYETWRARSSYLEVDAAAKIQQTVLELFQSLR